MPMFQLPLTLENNVAGLMGGPLSAQLMEPDVSPYWITALDSEHCGRTVTEVNDDSMFSVELDVTQFHPEELSLSLEDHTLTVQGQQQLKRDNAVAQRSFMRSWTLPPRVIEEKMRSSLSKEGILHIEGPKKSCSQKCDESGECGSNKPERHSAD